MIHIISYFFCRYLVTNKNYQNVLTTPNIEYNIVTFDMYLNMRCSQYFRNIPATNPDIKEIITITLLGL